MEHYTYVLPIKNAVLLSEACLSAGEESKFLGSSTSCEVSFDQGIQGGENGVDNKRKYSKFQLTKLRNALARARSNGFKDTSLKTRSMLFKALDK